MQTFFRAAAPAALTFAAAIIASPAVAADPQSADADAQEEVEAEKADKKSSAIIVPEIKEEERICRRVKLDMSSRRATKVCKTKDEWREFNQRR